MLPRSAGGFGLGLIRTGSVMCLLREFSNHGGQGGLAGLAEATVSGGWDRRAVGHAACFLGGARDRGTSPRRNVSMMRITPPQSGHGSRNVSGMISAVDASSCAVASSPNNARILAMLALRAALASRP